MNIFAFEVVGEGTRSNLRREMGFEVDLKCEACGEVPIFEVDGEVQARN